MHRITYVVAIAVGLALSLPRANAQGVAKFRVAGAELKGDTATINVAWEYALHSASATGKGVQFHLHKGKPPGYPNAATGTPIGTVDMEDGSGMAKLTFDAKKLGVAPGAQLTLTGRWPNNHQWGTDVDRPGGEFTLPEATKNSRLKRARWQRSGLRGLGLRLGAARWPARRLGPSVRRLGPSARRLGPSPRLRLAPRRIGR